MKHILRITFVVMVLVSCVCLTLEPVIAQADNESGTKSSTESVLQEGASEEGPREVLSDAERVIALQNTIKTEEESLTKLKEELEEPQKIFDELSNTLENLASQKEEKVKQLQELKEQDKDYDAAELEGEIKRLEEEKELIKQRSTLALELLRTTQQQIRTLEEKNQKDRAVLDKLKGIEKQEETLPAATALPAVPDAGDAAPEAALALPGLATQPADKEDLMEKTSTEKPATTEQIAARQEAEEKAKDARKAERAIVEYVERKKILEEQIALEESQLKTISDAYDNFEKTLNLKQKELEQKITNDKPQAELLKLQKEIRVIDDETEKIEDDIRKRNERINDLHEQYQALLEEELEVMAQADRKRKEAEISQQKSVWLESPFHPKNLLRWATTRTPQILLTILVLFLLRFIAHLSAERLTRLIIRRGTGTSSERESRAQTLAGAFKDAASVVIYVGGTLLLLESAGVNIKTLLGGAAVLGLAVAFGAQNLMRDYFYGFMILLEGQYKLNDIITIGDATGVVEHMTMRLTVLRDLEGRAHFIPNGQIVRVTNRTHEWSRAVFDIRVSYKEDADRIMDILVQLGRELQQDPEFSSAVIEEPQMLGVDKLDESAIVIKFIMKTQPTKMWPVRREMLRRIKNKFDELGIKIPAPYRIRLEQEDGGRS